MRPQHDHAHEDRLLEYAYGELPAHEADAVRAHVEGCEKCRGALEGVQRVRRAVAPLKDAPVPDAGLESLLAYAKRQAAHATPVRARRRFTRWALPFAGGIAAVFVAILAARELHPQEQAPEAPVLVAQKSAPPAPDYRAEPAAEQAAPAGLDAMKGAAGAFGAEAMRQKKELARREGSSRSRVASRGESMEAAPLPPRPASSAEVVAERAEEEEAPAERELLPGSVASGAAAGSPASAEARAPARAAQDAAPRAAMKASPDVPSRNVTYSDGPRLYAEAREAGRRGDRTAEAQRLREALAAGLGGAVRWDALLALCEAEFSLGARDAAARACQQLVREAPGSTQGREAQARLAREGL